MSCDSQRALQWDRFAQKVHDHIEEYTVPQYGDLPDDMASNFTQRDFNLQLQKYVSRQLNGGGKRGKENDALDYLKIAHYACMAYAKMKGEDFWL